MTARIKHWTVRRSRRRVHGYWEIVNGRGVIAVVYTNEADAECMASAPRAIADRDRAITELQHMVAIVESREGELRASERAALNRSRELIARF